jgi:hypothetical protein
MKFKSNGARVLKNCTRHAMFTINCNWPAVSIHVTSVREQPYYHEITATPTYNRTLIFIENFFWPKEYRVNTQACSTEEIMIWMAFQHPCSPKKKI